MKRVLLDENLPRLLCNDLSAFITRTVNEAGWAGIRNGELLRLAENEYDVFVTADKSIPYQHNLSSFALAFVVLDTRSTKLHDLQSIVPSLRDAIASASAGKTAYVRRTDP